MQWLEKILADCFIRLASIGTPGVLVPRCRVPTNRLGELLTPTTRCVISRSGISQALKLLEIWLVVVPCSGKGNTCRLHICASSALVGPEATAVKQALFPGFADDRRLRQRE